MVAEPVVLELNEVPVGAEDVAVLARRGERAVALPRDELHTELGGQAPRQTDDPLRVLGQELLVDAGPVVEALEVGGRDEAQQVPIPDLVLCEQRQVVVLLLALARRPVEAGARGNVGLDPDDRLDPRRPGCRIEPQRAEHRAVVGHRERRHPMGERFAEDRGRARVGLRRLDPRGAVQQRVLGVGVQMDELLSHTVVRPSVPSFHSPRVAVENLHACDSRGIDGTPAPRQRQGRRSARAIASAAARSSGSGSVEVDSLARDRMREREPPRVQERPVEAQHTRLVPTAPVSAVADDRVPRGLQVHADLMGPPGPRRRLQQARAREPLPHLEARRRGASLRAVDDDPSGAPAERRLDGKEVVGRRAADERQVATRDVVAAEHLLERPKASSVLATTSSPLVPASSRWTIPGRSGPPAGASGTPMAASRSTRVSPPRLAVGCVTTPAGFATTRRSSSRKRIGTGPPGDGSSGLASRSTTSRSPPRRRYDFGRALPSTRTPPAAIARCTSARGAPRQPGDHRVQPARRRLEVSRHARHGPPRTRPLPAGSRRTRSSASATLNTGQTCGSMKSTTRPVRPGPRNDPIDQVAEGATEDQSEGDTVCHRP